jgi:copper transport protein
VLPMFSRLALGCVAVLVATGTYQSWRSVWPLAGLWSTDYGRTLLIKIGCVTVLAGLGYLSRTVVQRRYVRPVAYALAAPAGPVGRPAPAGSSGRHAAEVPVLRQLRLAVGLEVAIAAVVLALTAVLVGQVPAKASYVAPYGTTLRLADGGSVQLSVTPARQGANTVRLAVLDDSGEPRDPQEVTLSVALPSAQIGPLPVELARSEPGRFQSTSASLPSSGTWEFVVRVRVGEFDSSVAQAEVPIR